MEQVIKTATGRDYIHTYDNVAEYYNECLKPIPPGSLNHSRTGSADWTGSGSWEETLGRYSKGYPEGTAKAKELSMKLTPFLRTVKGIKKGWKPQRYAGGNFLIDNYTKGLPDICNVMSPVISKKFASIIMNVTASAGVDADIMQARGVAIVALCHILETQNYRVSLKVAYGESGDTGVNLYTVVNLKAFNQTLDLDRVAFFFADPSSFRRLNFAYMETRNEDIIQNIVHRSYGRPCDLPKNLIGEKDIYLSKAHFHEVQWHKLESTIDFLKQCLKRYGVEFNTIDAGVAA